MTGSSKDPLGDEAFFRKYTENKNKSIKIELRKESLGPAYAFLSNSPISNIDPFGLNRSLHFLGHMWIVVDTWNNGTKTGSTILSFQPETLLGNGNNDWTIGGEQPYPFSISMTLTSGECADKQLLRNWQTMGYSNIHWNGFYNCWAAALAFIRDGMK